MAEWNLNHISQDTLSVGTLPVSLPVQYQTNAQGARVLGTSGVPIKLDPRHALIYVMNQPVRWRADGIAPDSAPGMGMFVPAGGYITWTDALGDFSSLIQRVQFVRAETATGNATLEISFFN